MTFCSFFPLQSQVDVVSPIVVFKYDDTKEGPGLEKAPYAGESDEVENQSTLPKPLLNAFNTWVGKLYRLKVWCTGWILTAKLKETSKLLKSMYENVIFCLTLSLNERSVLIIISHHVWVC